VTTHVSCRLPAALGEQLDSAAAENNAFRSELVRRAIRYYVRENPDSLDIFDQARDSPTASRATKQTDSDQSGGNDPYDPVEDLF